jgi:hypothetical protein
MGENGLVMSGLTVSLLLDEHRTNTWPFIGY